MLSYEEAFSKIEEATGIKDIDKLVANFIAAEEKNFAVFKFVNEQSADIETLESQIGEMQDEIDRLRDAGDLPKSEIQRRKDIKAME